MYFLELNIVRTMFTKSNNRYKKTEIIEKTQKNAKFEAMSRRNRIINRKSRYSIIVGAAQVRGLVAE